MTKAINDCVETSKYDKKAGYLRQVSQKMTKKLAT